MTLLKRYLKSFEKKCEEYNASPYSLESVAKNPGSLLLNENSESLSFSETSTILTSNLEVEQAILAKKYLHYYEDVTLDSRDEKYLRGQFLRKLVEKNEQLPSKLQPQYTIATKLISEDFDFAWQNGSLNLIKFLSFDLKNETSILEKSEKWYGKLNLLKAFNTNTEIRFDIIYSAPSAGAAPKSLDNALAILNEAEVAKTIVPESKLDSYINSISENFIQKG